ncbi:hypothetical protein [Filifactor alocis]
MKNIIYILFGFFIMLLELIFFNRVSLFGISANILIIYIATLSLFTSLDRVLFVSLLLGLGKDFIFERIFGLNAMILIVLGILFGRVKGSIYKDNWTIPLFLSSISSIIYMFIYSIFYKIYLGRAYSFLYSLKALGAFLFIEIVVSLVIYYPLRKIVQIVEDRW